MSNFCILSLKSTQPGPFKKIVKNWMWTIKMWSLFFFFLLLLQFVAAQIKLCRFSLRILSDHKFWWKTKLYLNPVITKLATKQRDKIHNFAVLYSKKHPLPVVKFLETGLLAVLSIKITSISSSSHGYFLWSQFTFWVYL